MKRDILKKMVSELEQYSGGVYDAWGDKIDPKKIENAQISHKRANEYIFFLSDFTFWGSANNSVIATENGISFKYADKLEPLFLSWTSIDRFFLIPNTKVKIYSNGKCYELQMFQSGIQDSYEPIFDKLVQENVSDFYKETKGLVKDIDNIIEKNILDKITVLNKLNKNIISKEELKKYINRCDELLNVTLTVLESKYNDYATIQAADYMDVFYARSQLLLKLGETDHVQKELLDYINQCQNGTSDYFSAYFKTCILLAKIYKENKEMDNAEVFLSMAAQTESPEYKRQANTALEEVKAEKKQYLRNSPQVSRQMVLCINDIPTWPVNEFCFVDPQMLRSCGWKFEPGHPQEGEMYICHPLRTDCYYEVQSFHDKLFDEKRSELVYLLESLGALKLRVETMVGTSSEHEGNKKISIAGSDGLITGSSAEIHNQSNELSRESKLQVAIEERELNPSANPHIPDDLVWYPHESTWQRIAQSALAKRYKTLSVELRYHEDFSINNRRMTQVQSNLKFFRKKIEIGWNSETEERLRHRKNTVWKYTAVFEEDVLIPTEQSKSSFTDIETEYLEDLRDALSNGTITESGRRILERQRAKLNITTERAQELEQSLFLSNLSEDEKEYLDDLHDCLENGVISETGRRILERHRKKLGIEEDRALQLEQMLNNGQKGN